MPNIDLFAVKKSLYDAGKRPSSRLTNSLRSKAETRASTNVTTMSIDPFLKIRAANQSADGSYSTTPWWSQSGIGHFSDSRRILSWSTTLLARADEVIE
jgi:hypothetical protein